MRVEKAPMVRVLAASLLVAATAGAVVLSLLRGPVQITRGDCVGAVNCHETGHPYLFLGVFVFFVGACFAAAMWAWADRAKEPEMPDDPFDGPFEDPYEPPDPAQGRGHILRW
jgi:hypothetical protein